MQTKPLLVVLGRLQGGVLTNKWVREGYDSAPPTKTAQTAK